MDNSTIDAQALKQRFNDMISQRRLPTTILTWIILIMGVVGNIMVMAAYGRVMHKRKKPASGRYLIQVLAVADLVACVFGGSFFIYFDKHRVTFQDNFLCKFALFSEFSTNNISVLCLLIISVHRYLKICRPHGGQMTVFWRRISITAIILFSIAISSPYFHFAQVVESHVKPEFFSRVLSLENNTFATSNITAHTCWAAYPRTIGWKIYYNILFIVQLGNMAVMIVLYIAIARLLHKKNKQIPTQPTPTATGAIKMAQTGQSKCSLEEGITFDSTLQGSTSMLDQASAANSSDNIDEKSKTRQRHKQPKTTWSSAKSRFTRMFMIIVIIYAITNFPTFIFLYLIVESEVFDRFFIFRAPYYTFNLILAMTRVHLINNAINPFIYGYFDVEFRRSVKKIFIDTCLHPRRRMSKLLDGRVSSITRRH